MLILFVHAKKEGKTEDNKEEEHHRGAVCFEEVMNNVTRQQKETKISLAFSIIYIFSNVPVSDILHFPSQKFNVNFSLFS